MSVKPLRQPKIVKPVVNSDKPPPSSNKSKLSKCIFSSQPLQVIVNLKDKSKLVVSLDAYHGLVQTDDYFKCIFCEIKIYEESKKDQHVKDARHLKWMENSPHLELYSENLLRQINNSGSYFCTLCSAVMGTSSLHRHLNGEAHSTELDKARNKAQFYKPVP